MSSSSQRRGGCGHMMAGFDPHSVCARCRDKKKGWDPCVENPEKDCKLCLALTPEQLNQLSTPSYKLKKEKRDAKSTTPVKTGVQTGGQPQFTRAGDITHTRDKSQGWIKDQIDQLGRIFLGLNVERTRESSNTHPDQPRASSRVNDNQCISFLPLRLLAGSSPQGTMNTLSVVKFNVVHPVPSAPGHSQKNEISPGAADCQSKQSKLKFVKGVSCVIPLSCAKLVINTPNVATNWPVGARLQNFWKVWLDLGAGPKAVQILKEGYTLPFRTRSRTPTVISCYGNPHRNLSLLEALHQLMDKNAIELPNATRAKEWFWLPQGGPTCLGSGT